MISYGGSGGPPPTNFETLALLGRKIRILLFKHYSELNLGKNEIFCYYADIIKEISKFQTVIICYQGRLQKPAFLFFIAHLIARVKRYQVTF